MRIRKSEFTSARITVVRQACRKIEGVLDAVLTDFFMALQILMYQCTENRENITSIELLQNMMGTSRRHVLVMKPGSGYDRSLFDSLLEPVAVTNVSEYGNRRRNWQ